MQAPFATFVRQKRVDMATATSLHIGAILPTYDSLLDSVSKHNPTEIQLQNYSWGEAYTHIFYDLTSIGMCGELVIMPFSQPLLCSP